MIKKKKFEKLFFEFTIRRYTYIFALNDDDSGSDWQWW